MACCSSGGYEYRHCRLSHKNIIRHENIVPEMACPILDISHTRNANRQPLIQGHNRTAGII